VVHTSLAGTMGGGRGVGPQEGKARSLVMTGWLARKEKRTPLVGEVTAVYSGGSSRPGSKHKLPGHQ
jgi:hypothetical protein